MNFSLDPAFPSSQHSTYLFPFKGYILERMVFAHSLEPNPARLLAKILQGWLDQDQWWPTYNQIPWPAYQEWSLQDYHSLHTHLASTLIVTLRGMMKPSSLRNQGHAAVSLIYIFSQISSWYTVPVHPIASWVLSFGSLTVVADLMYPKLTSWYLRQSSQVYCIPLGSQTPLGFLFSPRPNSQKYLTIQIPSKYIRVSPILTSSIHTTLIQTIISYLDNFSNFSKSFCPCGSQGMVLDDANSNRLICLLLTCSILLRKKANFQGMDFKSLTSNQSSSSKTLPWVLCLGHTGCYLFLGLKG